MPISAKPEFPPLLPPGLHRFWLSELDRLCVRDFPLSSTRRKIMDGLRLVVYRLDDAGIEGDLWINGSFVTKKIDPEDVDCVLKLPADYVRNATSEQQDVLAWFVSDLKQDFHCDSYFFEHYPPAHPLHGTAYDRYRYWRYDIFGTDRNNQPKGIASVSLPFSFVLGWFATRTTQSKWGRPKRLQIGSRGVR